MFVIGYIAAYLISRPINPMIQFAKKLAEGDLHTDSSSLLFPRDDTGDLSRALVTLQSDLIRRKDEAEKAQQEQEKYMNAERDVAKQNAALMRDIEIGLKEVADGNLNYTIQNKYTGEFSLVPEYLNDTNTKLRKSFIKSAVLESSFDME